MPRIIREFTLGKEPVRILPLHEGAQFLGFCVLSELHSDFAVSWWLDDESFPESPVTVYCCRSGDPLPWEQDPLHMASVVDISQFPRRLTFEAVHLFRCAGDPHL